MRPWGAVEWLLRMPSLAASDWDLIGAVSPQDRCMSLVHHADKSYKLRQALFLEILEEPSSFAAECARRRAASRRILEGLVPQNKRQRMDFDLFEPVARLKKIAGALLNQTNKLNILLDVSAMPEQFFFPLVRWFYESPKVDNFVVTYMWPESYTRADLAYNARDWAHLPTFVSANGSPTAIENVIVGVGFLPFSLPDWLKARAYDQKRVRISLIFPFPSEPANVTRGWEFVRRIGQNISVTERQLYRVDVRDLSGCYDRISQITRNGASPSVFAPYGPKSQSVAMCLSAINMGAEVFYTHPSYYHPEYSTGIRYRNGLPAGCAYALKLNGTPLYS